MGARYLDAPPSRWVQRFAPRIPVEGTALDVAAGGGRHTRYLRSLGYRVVSADIDVSKLEDLAGDERVRILETDLEGARWPFAEQSFDGVVVTNYLYRPHLPELVASVAPAGALIYESFARGNEKHGRPRNPDFLLRPGELRDLCASQMEIIAYEECFEADPRPAVRQRICATKGRSPS